MFASKGCTPAITASKIYFPGPVPGIHFSIATVSAMDPRDGARGNMIGNNIVNHGRPVQ